ncbi:HNH endonuclease signature motif containing protein [Rhizobium ruizarguesonis]
MARTKGHGNPNWTRDETILALDLYFRLGGNIPSPSDKRIAELSQLLRSMPYHQEAAKQQSFRNADGVGFKLMNLRQVATGKGLANVSKMDRDTWAEFGGRPEEVHRITAAIRAGIAMLRPEEASIDLDEFSEGRLLTALHLRRERSPKMRKLLLQQRRPRGLICEMCDLHRSEMPFEFQEALFEVHHILPLADSGERLTKLSDLALLCACCHRLIHKAIASTGQWLSVGDVKKQLSLGTAG